MIAPKGICHTNKNTYNGKRVEKCQEFFLSENIKVCERWIRITPISKLLV